MLVIQKSLQAFEVFTKIWKFDFFIGGGFLDLVAAIDSPAVQRAEAYRVFRAIERACHAKRAVRAENVFLFFFVEADISLRTIFHARAALNTFFFAHLQNELSLEFRVRPNHAHNRHKPISQRKIFYFFVNAVLNFADAKFRHRVGVNEFAFYHLRAVPKNHIIRHHIKLVAQNVVAFFLQKRNDFLRGVIVEVRAFAARAKNEGVFFFFWIL